MSNQKVFWDRPRVRLGILRPARKWSSTLAAVFLPAESGPDPDQYGEVGENDGVVPNPQEPHRDTNSLNEDDASTL
jgi:hypothetical protein